VAFIPASLIFGVILIMASIALFLLGQIKPGLKRDSDNVYALIGVICGLILTPQTNLGIGMLLQQIMLIGCLVVLMWENIQARTSSPSQARQPGGSSPFPRGQEEERPSHTYRAEYDTSSAYPPRMDDLGGRRQIRSGRWEDYDDRSSPRSSRSDSRLEPPASRRSRPEDRTPRSPRSGDAWGEEAPRSIPERSSGPRSGRETGPRDQVSGTPSRPGADRYPSDRPRRRPSESVRPSRRPHDDIPAADYVEFQPADTNEEAREPKGPKNKTPSWGPQE
jgi:hypothetical protein